MIMNGIAIEMRLIRFWGWLLIKKKKYSKKHSKNRDKLVSKYYLLQG